jgi:4a-hydroxytetrahydrobiopterin dehydratase
MTKDYGSMACEACAPGAPQAALAEVDAFLKDHPGWERAMVDGIPRVRRSYRFPDFRSALAFADAVGALAETQGHHPALLVEWGGATVSWWTHKIQGIHVNDLIMAARTDAAYAAARAA